MSSFDTVFNQSDYDVRCEWGENGLMRLKDICEVLVIIDVLSFTTAVDIAVGRGAWVYPFPYRDENAQAYAQAHQALLAGGTGVPYRLSPSTLLDIPPGTRLVLPSPNGSRLSRLAGNVPTIAGCLRNATAVSTATGQTGRKVGVIPAGERWPDGSLRPALEDLLGAGAVIHALNGKRSPEAETASVIFERFSASLLPILSGCSSGKELIARGRPEDVALAAQLDCSDTVPWLRERVYRP